MLNMYNLLNEKQNDGSIIIFVGNKLRMKVTISKFQQKHGVTFNPT